VGRPSGRLATSHLLFSPSGVRFPGFLRVGSSLDVDVEPAVGSVNTYSFWIFFIRTIKRSMALRYILIEILKDTACSVVVQPFQRLGPVASFDYPLTILFLTSSPLTTYFFISA